MSRKESEPTREPQSDPPYVRVARYASDGPAYAAYVKAEQLLFDNDCDLSAYRVRYRDVPHVILLGAAPPPDIDQQLATILSSGQPASLPSEILKALAERRSQARNIGPWVEGHYRPGRPM